MCITAGHLLLLVPTAFAFAPPTRCRTAPTRHHPPGSLAWTRADVLHSSPTYVSSIQTRRLAQETFENDNGTERVPPRVVVGSNIEGGRRNDAFAIVQDDGGSAVTTVDKHDDGHASIINLSISLVKSIVGSGVLALPAGIAHLSKTAVTPSLIWPAIILIGAVGLMNAFFFSLVGRVCTTTGATGYRDAWERTVQGKDADEIDTTWEALEAESTSSSGQWVAYACMAKAGLGCLAYSMIIADSFQSIAMAMGLDFITRTEALGAVTAVALLPLCLMKDLTSLAPFSLLGVVGMGFTTSVMAMRYFEGSYGYTTDDAPNFLSSIPMELQPSFDDVATATGTNVDPAGLAVLACTLATAFVAHYNAPRFHNELQNHTNARFDTVIAISFAVSALFFMIVAAAGFLTFGAGSDSFILNNYSPFDPLVTFSRVAVALSLIFTYPLPFVGLRDGVLDVLQVPIEERTDNTVMYLSMAILAVVTVGAAFVHDLTLVLSVGGGIFATAVVSVFPTLMFTKSVQDSTDPGDKLLVKIAQALMCVSVMIGATGVFFALGNAMQ